MEDILTVPHLKKKPLKELEREEHALERTTKGKKSKKEKTLEREIVKRTGKKHVE